uniref:Solute carrier family 2 member 11b n=1 Tax=Sinocyclocheilus grahami TaxID=75366 RepID=A0A672ML48_SINGR
MNNSTIVFQLVYLLCTLSRALRAVLKSLLLAVWAAGIGGTFQYGYNISIINAPTKVTTVIQFGLAVWFCSGQELPAHPCSLACMRAGRAAITPPGKGTLLFNNTFALLAAFFMGLSYPSSTFELLIVGRFLTGVNAGSIQAHKVVMVDQFCILGGSVPCSRRALYIHSPHLQSLPVRDSNPQPLVKECYALCHFLSALMWFHGPDKYHREKEDIERERVSAAGIKPKKPWELFTDTSLRWQLLTLVVIHMSQQLNGINAIYFYADYVFTQAGIPAAKIPYATVGTGACECITALTCGLLIESLGRRALIIGGYSLMSVCCVCFTIALTFQESSPWVPYLSMICVFAFILSFGLGPGGVTNILTTELFTQTDRPAAYMIGGSINWIAFFFIGMIFPFIVYCFLVFLVVCCLVATYIFFVVPETKNKTFLEIQSEFHSRKELIAANGTEGPLLSTPM